MNKKTVSREYNIIWSDRKRILGMPISFTRYFLCEKANSNMKIFTSTGLLYNQDEELNVFRIDDMSVYQSFANKIFGVGTIRLWCKDSSDEYVELINIKNPYKVRDMINNYIESERAKKGFKFSELSHA